MHRLHSAIDAAIGQNGGETDKIRIIEIVPILAVRQDVAVDKQFYSAQGFGTLTVLDTFDPRQQKIELLQKEKDRMMFWNRGLYF